MKYPESHEPHWRPSLALGQMTVAGPFWRKRATPSTTFETWGWCYLYFDGEMNLSIIAWL